MKNDQVVLQGRWYNSRSAEFGGTAVHLTSGDWLPMPVAPFHPNKVHPNEVHPDEVHPDEDWPSS